MDLSKCMWPEHWKVIPGTSNIYEASSLGRIRSVPRKEWFLNPRSKKLTLRKRRGCFLKPFKQKHNGYLRISLCLGGEKKKHYIHGLVCAAFHGPRPPGQFCRHLNGDKLDNQPTNLAWGTIEQDRADQRRHGTMYMAPGEDHPNAVMTEEDVILARELRQDGFTCEQIAKCMPCGKDNVWKIVTGKTWKHLHSSGVDNDKRQE